MTHSQSSYQENLAWLYRLQRFGIKLGLENMERLLRELDVPAGPDQKARGESGTPQSRTIHVAGTNGKGSVCAMAESICRAHGLRTGLFTSPHLVSFRERIQINGKLISEEDVSRGLTQIRQLIGDWDPHPTFFEVTTALALSHFATAKLDVVILETGLGGRLDATNVVWPTVSVITSIDLDHQKWLGDSIEKIAFEKAGIIKPQTPVVSSAQRAEAEKVIRRRAEECDAPIEFVRQAYERSPIGLSGLHQKQNAAVALAALAAAQLNVSEAAVEQGLRSVKWPARFQRWDGRTVIDGAHNPGSARTLASTWRESFGNAKATMILAMLADKDVRGICEALSPIADFVLLPPIHGERALPPQALAETLSSAVPQLPYAIAPSLGEAITVARAKSSPILIAGSLHFAGEALALLEGRPAAFEECAQ